MEMNELKKNVCKERPLPFFLLAKLASCERHLSLSRARSIDTCTTNEGNAQHTHMACMWALAVVAHSHISANKEESI
jgi:hypothetical protein